MSVYTSPADARAAALLLYGVCVGHVCALAICIHIAHGAVCSLGCDKRTTGTLFEKGGRNAVSLKQRSTMYRPRYSHTKQSYTVSCFTLVSVMLYLHHVPSASLISRRGVVLGLAHTPYYT